MQFDLLSISINITLLILFTQGESETEMKVKRLTRPLTAPQTECGSCYYVEDGGFAPSTTSQTSNRNRTSCICREFVISFKGRNTN